MYTGKKLFKACYCHYSTTSVISSANTNRLMKVKGLAKKSCSDCLCKLENYKQERSVAFYADKLCVTAKYLSLISKEVSGQPAGNWIDEYVILEAKTLLKSSQMSIQEIADSLNFANQSFFGKYFKHHTGISPKEYRKR